MDGAEQGRRMVEHRGFLRHTHTHTNKMCRFVEIEAAAAAEAKEEKKAASSPLWLTDEHTGSHRQKKGEMTSPLTTTQSE